MSEKVRKSLKELKSVDDVRYVEIDIPEWEGTYKFGSLTAGKMMKWTEQNEGTAKKTAGLRLVAESWIEPDGSRLAEPEAAINDLRDRDNMVIERILEALVKLNGLTVKGREDAKNASSEAQTAASHTVLH